MAPEGVGPAEQVDAAAGGPSVQSFLEGLRYEVMPFKGVDEKVLAHVPKDITVTVTASPGKGIWRTVDFAVRLAGEGYAVVPHLSSRMIKDKAELSEIIAKTTEAGIEEIFVVGGDAPEPAGTFTDAPGLVRALKELDHPFAEVGITGYPEGHADIGDERLDEALREKAEVGTYVATQICFDAGTILDWARGLQRKGITQPVWVGMPGEVNREKLVRISAGIGLGASARFLKKQQSMFWRFLLPGGYSPNKVVRGLAPHLGEGDQNIAGFHIFTFNEIEGTEKWRRRMLEKYSG
ncbi:methylenetetrahydrofolate reductase [Georgenia deserti]|uniref:Methylenetetrahydrofolate reductase n=1 Tax=Georgenia deserti TaxID=2093781 RepID=A0ABW4L1H5_9MICO